MICPAPAGIDPNNSVCGECGGRFTMPWVQEINGHALRCVDNADHETYASKNRGKTKMLAGPEGQKVEVDVLTQKPTTELMVYESEAAALETINQANSVGLFPQKATAEQAIMLAQVAMAYGLDPIMGELIPYQGRPYITIAGRRRLDAAAGHHVSVSYRPPSEDEERYLLKHQAIEEMDVIYYCILTDIDTGATVEGFGRVKAGEGGNNANLPQAQRKPEMAQKRAERRAREQMFGPAHKPQSIQGITVMEEGDESNIVESTGRVVAPADQPSQPQVLPEDMMCPFHNMEWFKKGKMRDVSHPVEGETGPRGGKVWCKMEDVFAELNKRMGAAGRNHNWDEAKRQEYTQIWRTMTPVERLAACIQLESVDPATGVVDGDKAQRATDDAAADDGPAHYDREVEADRQAAQTEQARETVTDPVVAAMFTMSDEEKAKAERTPGLATEESGNGVQEEEPEDVDMPF